jgi:hypothetical protein
MDCVNSSAQPLKPHSKARRTAPEKEALTLPTLHKTHQARNAAGKSGEID